MPEFIGSEPFHHTTISYSSRRRPRDSRKTQKSNALKGLQELLHRPDSTLRLKCCYGEAMAAPGIFDEWGVNRGYSGVFDYNAMLGLLACSICGYHAISGLSVGLGLFCFTGVEGQYRLYRVWVR